MDALEEATEETSRPLKRFVVTGASKRGWTAWLVGAARDGRVLGIAPMVFDNLRLNEQLQHQLASWGKYSEMLGDYTEKGLDQIVDTPTGRRLVAMTDPWTYRERLTLPKLIVIGSNDRYWATDALSLYWDALRGPKYVSVVPNAGHLLGDMKQALAAIAAFARSCAGEFAIAPHGGGLSEERGKKTYRVWVEATASKSAGPCTVAEPVGVWSATADNGDLRGARWERGAPTQSAEPKKGIARAFFGEVRHRFGDLAFTLSTPPAVVR
jgi:PhoPQ-activated pathogenicity-related protein